MAGLQVSCLLLILWVGWASAADVAAAHQISDDFMEDVTDTGRSLQATPRPCRWNPNYGSCDFNYEYVASIKPTNPAAAAARRWFINAKSCDSAAYQASKIRCEGDNSHFCRWIGGTGSVKCIAVLQEYYNHLLACPKSIAKDFYFCKNKFTRNNCVTNPACRWITPAGKTPFCSIARLSATSNTYLNSDNLKAFRAAWGVCDGSNMAFNQTLCSKKKSRTACVGAKFCTWGVFSTGGVCYTSSTYSPLFIYRNDPSFRFLIKACAKSTKATCEGTLAPTTRLSSLDG